ncbi:MAG TPA: right-handed parallel beta-helix repeat-containing protein [Blastocatellia bacterium]|nr:right-handed parallel beta-helix repeat-containing protein [Blastocatellia bacterium]
MGLRFRSLVVSPCVLTLLLAAGTAASANTIYVATNGNDSNPGTAAAPVATLSRAYSLASTGDSIYLRAGRYVVTRQLTVEKDGITIASYPGESAAIAGSTSDTTNLQSVISIVSSNVSLIGLEIQGGSYYGVKSESNSGMLIRNCHIFGTGRDCVKMFNADNATIEGCDIGPSGVRDSSNAEGIDSVGSRSTIIRGCYIHDTTTNGLYLKGGASGCVVERNRVERTGHSGILLGQDTDLEFMRDGTPYEALDSVVRNNIVIGTVGAGVGTYSGSNVRFENNTLYDVARSYNGGFYIAMNSRDVSSRQVRFKNNIVIVLSDRPIVFVINLADQLVSDSNIWYRPSGGDYQFWRETPTSGDYWVTFADWQRGLGVDGRSLTVNPTLDSTKLFKPVAGSPAIDRGEPLAGVTVDYSGVVRPQGNGFDIGAHEATSNTPANQPPTVQISATPLSGQAPLSVNFTAVASDSDGQVVGYAWDFGDGQSATTPATLHVYNSSGNYTARVTVTDNAGASASATAAINATGGASTSIQNVEWIHVVGCSVSGNSLTKIVESIWGNAGAASSQAISTGDGYVQFTAVETNRERACGLSNTDRDQNFTSIAFGVHLNTGGAFYVVESGQSRGYFGDYRSGDVFKVALESGRVKYYRNGTVFYTSSVTPSYPLIVDAALDGEGSTIANALISFASGGPPTSSSLSVRVLRPAETDVLVFSQQYQISWSVIQGTAVRHNVDLSLDGGTTWTKLATGLTGATTSLAWKVPRTKTRNGLIRVTSFAADGQSSQDIGGKFSIVKRL